MKAIICADAQSWGIGANNQLLYRSKEDMQYFRSLTLNQAVLMGSNTYFSIGHPLEKRINIVLTRKEIPNVHIIKHVEEAQNFFPKSDIWLIGGGQMYESYIDLCETAYVTKIKTNKKADTFCPNLDKMGWKIISNKKMQTEDGEFLIYKNPRI